MKSHKLKYFSGPLAFICGVVLIISCQPEFEPEIVTYPEMTIGEFSPATGRPGTPVMITGTNFGDHIEAVTVTFSGVEGEVTNVVNDTIMAVAPEDGTAGKISVKVWLSEKEFEEDFLLMPGAVVSSYSSKSGSAGDIITVTGENFGTDAGNVEVAINGVSAGIIFLSDTEIQFQIPDTGTGDLTLTFDDQQVIEGPGILIFSEGEAVKITGELFGHAGSWGNNPATEISAAIDGDLNTFVDGATSSGYVGYQVADGYGVILTTIRYAPRGAEWATARMVGAEIRGTNDPANVADPLSGDYEVLHTIDEAPAVGEYTQVELTSGNVYTYVYYYSPDGYCNISEIEFYGMVDN